MWSDNEASQNCLNFQMVADTAVEMIIQSSGRPLSLGVSGGWGVGKTTMIRLIESALTKRCDDTSFFVQFNAWLHKGYAVGVCRPYPQLKGISWQISRL